MILVMIISMNKMMKTMTIATACAATLSIGACSTPSLVSTGQAPRMNYEVSDIRFLPDKPFVQGFELYGDDLVIGTGLEGSSEVFRYDKWLTDDTVLDKSAVQKLDAPLFGEGVTVTKGDKPVMWQLTWKDGVAIKRSPDTLQEIGRVDFDREGWGACATQDSVVTSDGSSTLVFRDLDTLERKREITVTESDSDSQNASSEVKGLNELECVTDDDGTDYVWSNVYGANFLYKVNLETGDVAGVVDISRLVDFVTTQYGAVDVVNGIAAVDDAGDKLIVTGKLWPVAFFIDVKDPSAK